MSEADRLQEVRSALAGVGRLEGSELLDAVATVCWLIAGADGVVGREEAASIADALERVGGSTDEIAHVQAKFMARALTGRAPAPDDEIAALGRRLVDPQQRRVALAYGAAVAWANGILDVEEQGTLAALAAAFAIPTDEASRIVDGATGR